MGTTDGEPSFLLDLSKVEHERRLLAWREWMRASFPEFTLGDLPLPAEGGARGIAIGDARLWLLRCPPGRIRRSPDPSSPRNALVGLMLMGSSTIHREGRHYHLHKDQLCIGRVAPDGAEMSSDEPTVFLLLELPVSWLTARYPQLEALSFHTSSSDQPAVALLRDLLLGAIAVGERLAEHERRVALSAAVELLILPFAGVRPVDPGVLRVERALATVDQSLGEPRLNAARLARAHGISRRRLDELFVAALGVPVAAFISDRRLRRAAELLRDPAPTTLSVSEVALRVGFRDLPHFSRAFRRRFGSTPKDWRRGPTGADPSELSGSNKRSAARRPKP